MENGMLLINWPGYPSRGRLVWEMTDKLAKEVLYVFEGEAIGSWRALSKVLSERHPTIDFGDGHQIAGMYLEREAKLRLNIEIEYEVV